MNTKRFLINSITVALLGLTLTACGGGGSDSPSKETTPTNPTTPPVVVNTAPTLILDNGSATIEENQSYTLNFTTTDAENDSVIVSVSGGGDHLTSVVNGNSVTINSGEVNADTTSTFSIKASDGKLTTTKTFSLKVVNVEPVIDTTSINLTQSSLELGLQKEGFVQFSLSNNVAINPASLVVDFDNTVLSSVTYVQGQGLRVVSRNNETATSVKFSVKDINGVQSAIATLNVNVVDSNENKNAPTLTFENQVNDTFNVEVQPNSTVSFPFTIEDTDSNDSSLDCVLKDLNVVGDVVNFNYKLDCANRELQITTENVESESMISFTVQATDGEFKSSPVYVVAMLKSINNESAKIDFDYEKPFLKVTEKSSATLSYTITDDGITEVVFNEVQAWYGNESDYTITHNANNHSFTVTPNENLTAADTFGVVLSFKDGSNYVNHYLEVKVIAPIGDVENRALALIEKYDNAMKASREYNVLGVAYTDYLFSVGKISYTEKEVFDVKFGSDSRDAYASFGQYKVDILSNIENGEFASQPDYLNYFIDFIDENIDALFVAGVAIEGELNTLASKDSVLPAITVTGSFVELGDTHFSRLIGNNTYGEFVDSKWVFDTEYAFLNVISSQTNNVSFVK